MDELHARVRAFRSLPTELNLAKQPDTDVDDADDTPRQGEANVVEMPQRQTHEAFVPHSSEPLPTSRLATKHKQSTSAKRKAAASRQPAFPFQQMRDGHQQPYIDELKRLEAQAERINQLLAARKRKQAGAEQAARLSVGQAVRQPTDEPLVEVEQAAIKKKAPKSTRQASKQPPRSSQREVLPMAAPDDETAALEAQAERIKQLLQALESAIVAGEALPHTGTDRNGTERNGTDRTDGRDPTEDRLPTVDALAITPISALDPEAVAFSTYRYGAEAQAFAVNQMQATTGTTDQKAQQEAAETAQALRALASRESAESTIASPQPASRRHAVRSRDRRSGSTASPPALRYYGVMLRQFLQMPQASLDRVGDAVLWIVLAAAIRVGARFLLVPFPALAPVLLVLMFAPAAVAVYLAMFVPKAGFVSFYRLFLIMVGLLLGGRF